MFLFCNSLQVRNDCDKIIVKFIVKVVPNTNAFYKITRIYFFFKVNSYNLAVQYKRYTVVDGRLH